MFSRLTRLAQANQTRAFGCMSIRTSKRAEEQELSTPETQQTFRSLENPEANPPLAHKTYSSEEQASRSMRLFICQMPAQESMVEEMQTQTSLVPCGSASMESLKPLMHHHPMQEISESPTTWAAKSAPSLESTSALAYANMPPAAPIDGLC